MSTFGYLWLCLVAACKRGYARLCFLDLRCSLAFGLRYVGDVEGWRRVQMGERNLLVWLRHRVYATSSQKVVSRTRSSITFRGGMKVMTPGGLKGGDYGRVVVIWQAPESAHFLALNCSDKR